MNNALPIKKNEPRERIQDQFAAAVGEVARSWRDKLNRRLKPLGLSQSRWRALLYISRSAEGLSQTELARMLSIEAPTVTRLVSHLEEDGWVRRRTALHDGRCRLVVLTPKAKRIIVHIEQAVTELRAETVGRLSEAQAAAGLVAIRAFQAYLDQI